MQVDGVSAFALVAADRARDEGERSLMRRRAHERLEEIGRDLGDWAALGELSGERWEQARAVMREEIAAACDWWRAQLAEQGHAPDRVEVFGARVSRRIHARAARPHDRDLIERVDRRPTGTHSPCTLNRLQRLTFPALCWVPIGRRPNLEPLT